MTTNNPTAAIPLEVLERATRAIAEEFDSVTILSDYYKEKLARAALLAAGWAEMAAELAAARSLLVTRVEAARLDEAMEQLDAAQAERDEARKALATLIAATVRARNADDDDERFMELQAEVEDAHVSLINVEIEARRVLGNKEGA